jgi:hypothetical protein
VDPAFSVPIMCGEKIADQQGKATDHCDWQIDVLQIAKKNFTHTDQE